MPKDTATIISEFLAFAADYKGQRIVLTEYVDAYDYRDLAIGEQDEIVAAFVAKEANDAN